MGKKEIGVLPKINKNTKLELTVNCKDIFKNPKYSRVAKILFAIENNHLKVKIGRLYFEIGRLEQITFDEYCEFVNIRKVNVFSFYKDLYKISLDKELIHKYYEEKKCLTTEDLCLAVGYLNYIEHNCFFNLCLLDFEEIPNTVQNKFIDGRNFDFVAVENKDAYPEVDYKIDFI